MTPASPFPVSTPEGQGVPSAAIAAFIDAIHANGIELHSFILLRHGRRIAQGWWEPYAADAPHILFSLSKSFASTAVGLAIAEGRLRVDDPVTAFFLSEMPAAVSDNLAAMRVQHLLSMTTGHAVDATPLLREAPDGNWVRAFLHSTIDEPPGSHFVYNSAATYMCSAIVQQLTGMTLLDYLTPRLFAPLGFTNPTWESCPRGINVGGWGMRITSDEIARFGQLYLQQGQWQGRQIVPASWVVEATRSHIATDHPGDAPGEDWQQGYGYQWWRCRHNAYRGDGAFGQFCVVLPDQEAVLAITAGQGDMQIVLDQVWAHLLPAMGDRPLAEDRTAQTTLQQTLAGLRLPTVRGAASSVIAAQVSGQAYDLPENSQGLAFIRFDFSPDQSSVVIADHQGEHRIVCGHRHWHKGRANSERSGSLALAANDRSVFDQMVAASGAWVDDHTYTAILRFYETPFALTLQSRFAGDRLVLDATQNVAFGATARPQLVGRTTA